MIQVIYEDLTFERFLNEIIERPGKKIKAQKILTENEINKIPLLKNGKIVMIDPPPYVYTIEEKKIKLREIRNNILDKTVWIINRHLREVFEKDKGWTQENPTLTDSQFREWTNYRRTLRKLINILDFNNIEYKDIIETNNNIFPIMPEIINGNVKKTGGKIKERK